MESLTRDAFRSPESIAESMAKRFKQVVAALPAAVIPEIFSIILDNRYKLLGNIVSLGDRSNIIRLSQDSLALLTFHVYLAEVPEARDELATDQIMLSSAINDIHRKIQCGAPNFRDMPLSDFAQKAREVVSS